MSTMILRIVRSSPGIRSDGGPANLQGGSFLYGLLVSPFLAVGMGAWLFIAVSHWTSFSAGGAQAGEIPAEPAAEQRGRALTIAELNAAAAEYRREVETLESSGDQARLGEVCERTADVYRAIGDLIVAKKWLEKALRVNQELNDPAGEARILTRLGLLFADWGDCATATAFYDRAVVILDRLQDKSAVAAAFMENGNAYRRCGMAAHAAARYEQALATFEKTGAAGKRARELIIGLQLDAGDLDKAWEYLKDTDSSPLLARFCLLKSYRPASHPYAAMAKTCYEGVLESRPGSRDPRFLFSCHTGLGAAYEGMDRFDKAESHFRKAAELIEAVRAQLSPAQRWRAGDLTISGFHWTAPYHGLARVFAKTGRFLDGLKTVERIRAEKFAETMKTRHPTVQSTYGIPEYRFRRDLELNERAALAVRSDKHRKATADAVRAEEAGKDASQAKQELDVEIARLRSRYPEFAAVKYPQPFDPEHAALKKDEWAVIYSVSDPALLIFVINGKRLVKALWKPIPAADLRRLVEELRNPRPNEGVRSGVDTRASSRLKATERLSEVLLREVLSVLPPDKPVIIMPDHCLALLPFEMLPQGTEGPGEPGLQRSGSAGSKTFGDRNPVSYYHSISALNEVRTHHDRSRRRNRLVLMTDPILDENHRTSAHAEQASDRSGGVTGFYWHLFEEVVKPGKLMSFESPSNTADLRSFVESTYRRRARIYAEKDATKKKLRQRLEYWSSGCGTVVFATPCYVGYDFPGIMEPVIVLTLIPPGTDGYLTLREIMGLRMKADLVILTDVRAGPGSDSASYGEGLMATARALQYAGARSVLVCLSAGSDSWKAAFLKEFLKHLKAGKDKLEALHLARDANSREAHDDQDRRAGFVLVGESTDSLPR